MKILLISDTHGKLDEVNRLAKETKADACFHLGDLCTYTKESVPFLSEDILLKQIEHAKGISPETVVSFWNKRNVKAMRDFAMKHRTYGNFEEYLSGEKQFSVPVFAVPGNNEDSNVLNRLSDHSVQNLEILKDSDCFMNTDMDGFFICGLGGGKEAGDAHCNYGFTSEQINSLRKNVLKKNKSGKPVILLTHVPPYEHDGLADLIRDLKPSLSICGHSHHYDEQKLDNTYPILTLPSVERGYGVLELDNGSWNYHVHFEKQELVRTVVHKNQERADLYGKIARFLEQVVLLKAFPDASLIQVRIKSNGSIAGKVLKKYASCTDPNEIVDSIQDVLGARVIYLRQDKLDSIDAVLRDPNRFELDEINTEDTGKRHSENEFGYLSKHYMLRITPDWLERQRKENKKLDEAISKITDLMNEKDIKYVPVELQVRTWLQNLWAELTHDGVYKTNRIIPRKMQRSWSAMAALLEKTDEDIVQCVKELEQHQNNRTYFIDSVLKKKTADLEIIGKEILCDMAQNRNNPVKESELRGVRDELIRLYCLNGDGKSSVLLKKMNQALKLSENNVIPTGLEQYKNALKSDPENPQLLMKCFLKEKRQKKTADGSSGSCPIFDTSSFILPTFLRSAIQHCNEMIKNSRDLPWAFAGKAFLMLLLKCLDPDDGKDDLDAIYDAVLRVIDLCNERSVFNLKNEKIVATSESRDALKTLCAIVALHPFVKLKTTNEKDGTAPLILCISELLKLGKYAHLSKTKSLSPPREPAVIIAGGCGSLMRQDDPSEESEELLDFKQLFRASLNGGKKIDFYTGTGNSGICRLDFGDDNQVLRFGIEADRNNTPDSSYSEYSSYSRHSIYEAICEWKYLRDKRKCRFDDVALVGFGLSRLSSLECRIALALGARVTVVGHKNFIKDQQVFRGIPYWSDHPSLVHLPLIRGKSPANNSIEDKASIEKWRNAGFPEPMMLRVFMLFKPYHEEDYNKSSADQTLYLIHRIKQIRTSSTPLDLHEIDKTKCLSEQHRQLFFKMLLDDSGEELPRIIFPRMPTTPNMSLEDIRKWLDNIRIDFSGDHFRFGEREHARWFIERWLQGTRYGKNKIDRGVSADQKKNPCMVAWYDLEDDTIKKDTEFLGRYAVATEIEKPENRFIVQTIDSFFHSHKHA